MEIWNSGTLTVSESIPPALSAAIDTLFENDDTIHIGDRDIVFEDSPGYMLEFLNKLAALLEKNGLSISEGDYVRTYGDFDDYIVWHGGMFETMDPDEFVIFSLTDVELINIAKSRGFCICKAPAGCPNHNLMENLGV